MNEVFFRNHDVIKITFCRIYNILPQQQQQQSKRVLNEVNCCWHKRELLLTFNIVVIIIISCCYCCSYVIELMGINCFAFPLVLYIKRTKIIIYLPQSNRLFFSFTSSCTIYMMSVFYYFWIDSVLCTS